MDQVAEEADGDGDADQGEKELDLTPAGIRQQLLASVEVSEEQVVKLLKLPQRYPDGRAHAGWLAARRNRVTASRFASACSAQGARSNRKVVVTDMLTLPEGRAAQASRYGVQHEDVAREAYLSFRRSQGGSAKVDLEVQALGICVWREEPWLAGSPDGLCTVNGRPEGLLEIKTAQSWNDLFQSEELPIDWRYQVQGCMRVATAALGVPLNWCDLFFWTPVEQLCRREHFDTELWEKAMYPSLRHFYFNVFLPQAVEHERERRQRLAKQRPKKASRRHGRKHK